MSETRVNYKARVAELEARVAGLYYRRPVVVPGPNVERENLERLLALATARGHPLWEVVLSYADEHARNEEQAALGPNLADAERQYNAGRAAAALDFAMALRELLARAEAEAAKAERSKG